MATTNKIQRFGVFDPNEHVLPEIEDNNNDQVTEAFFYALYDGDYQVLDAYPETTHFNKGDFLCYVKGTSKKIWFKAEPTLIRTYLDGKPVFDSSKIKNLEDIIFEQVRLIFASQTLGDIKFTFNEDTNTINAQTKIDELTIGKNKFGQLYVRDGKAPIDENDPDANYFYIWQIIGLSEKIKEIEERLASIADPVFLTSSIRLDEDTLFLNERFQIEDKNEINTVGNELKLDMDVNNPKFTLIQKGYYLDDIIDEENIPVDTPQYYIIKDPGFALITHDPDTNELLDPPIFSTEPYLFGPIVVQPPKLIIEQKKNYTLTIKINDDIIEKKLFYTPYIPPTDYDEAHGLELIEDTLLSSDTIQGYYVRSYKFEACKTENTNDPDFYKVLDIRLIIDLFTYRNEDFVSIQCFWTVEDNGAKINEWGQNNDDDDSFGTFETTELKIGVQPFNDSTPKFLIKN
jgi:hypothetical protein